MQLLGYSFILCAHMWYEREGNNDVPMGYSFILCAHMWYEREGNNDVPMVMMLISWV